MMKVQNKLASMIALKKLTREQSGVQDTGEDVKKSSNPLTLPNITEYVSFHTHTFIYKHQKL